MSKNIPRVSIGMPVYNAGRFLKEAIDSIVAQTFKDFELIISDNASIDKTEEICREYAAKDQRIRYYRNKKNIGAVKNFSRVFELSTGEYFKWAAHDDLCAPEYLERCIDVLDREPSAVICHPKTSIIDEFGKHIKDYDDLLDFRSSKSHKRFHDYLFRRAGMWNAVLGVIRANELKKTPLLKCFGSADRVLLGELVLLGKIYQVSDRLFYRRRHPGQSWRKNSSPETYAIWLNPEKRIRNLLTNEWKLFYGYLFAIKRVRLSLYDRMWCYFYVMRWGGRFLVLRPINRYWMEISKCKKPQKDHVW